MRASVTIATISPRRGQTRWAMLVVGMLSFVLLEVACVHGPLLRALSDDFEEAEKAYRHEEFDAAISRYESITSGHSKYRLAQIGIGKCLWQKKEMKRATKQLISARRLDTEAFDSKRSNVKALAQAFAASIWKPIAKPGEVVKHLYNHEDGSVTTHSIAGSIKSFAPSGKLKWEMNLGNRRNTSGHIATGPNSYKMGKTFFSIGYHKKTSYALAIDSEKGSILWSRDLGALGEHAELTAHKQMLFTPTAGGLNALDAKSGELLWKAETSDQVGQVVVAGESVCAEYGKTIGCWNGSDGTSIGQHELSVKRSGIGYAHSVKDQDDTLYQVASGTMGGIVSDSSRLFFTVNTRLLGLDIDSMKVVWQQPIESKRAILSVDQAQGEVVVVSTKKLRTFDLETGSPRLNVSKPGLDALGQDSAIAPTIGDGGWLVASGLKVFLLNDSGNWDWIMELPAPVTTPVTVAAPNTLRVAVKGTILELKWHSW